MLSVPCPLLQAIYADGGFTAPNGERVDLARAGGIGWPLAEAIYRTIVAHKPGRALEIGMASGISALSILTGLSESGGDGTLTSIDPFQATWGRGAGIDHVAKAGFAARHRLIEEADYLALPRLLDAGEKFDFIYIDGNHDFEYVVLDFFYADRLLGSHGIIGFNDCGWASVHTAMQGLPLSRDYEELSVGLKPDYKGRNLAATAIRWWTGRSGSDRYFRKKA